MYPSKSDGMFVPESLIFRSDSNGEDLEGYAGAGLYDSITMDKTELRKVDYASDKCVTLCFLPHKCTDLPSLQASAQNSNVHPSRLVITIATNFFFGCIRVSQTSSSEKGAKGWRFRDGAPGVMAA